MTRLIQLKRLKRELKDYRSNTVHKLEDEYLHSDSTTNKARATRKKYNEIIERIDNTLDVINHAIVFVVSMKAINSELDEHDERLLDDAEKLSEKTLSYLDSSNLH